jgi:hypothetical protein
MAVVKLIRITSSIVNATKMQGVSYFVNHCGCIIKFITNAEKSPPHAENYYKYCVISADSVSSTVF